MALFRSQGFEATTMEQIAETADVAKKTLYNYFPNKASILIEYIQREISDFEPEFQRMIDECGDTRSRISAIWQWMMEWFSRNREFTRLYLSTGMENPLEFQELAIRSSLLKSMTKIIKLGQESGELREDIPFDVLARLIYAVWFMVMLGWMGQGDDYPVQFMLESALGLILNGAIKCN